MSSFVGVSRTQRALLTEKAAKLQGTLRVTLHKALHLKHSSLRGSSDAWASLSVGTQKFRSKVTRDGGQHPEWQQEFIFALGGAANDGFLHIQLFDAEARDKCIGRLDLNFILLLAHDKATEAQWLPVADERAQGVQQGFLCITAIFNGTGLEQPQQPEDQQVADDNPQVDTAAAAALEPLSLTSPTNSLNSTSSFSSTGLLSPSRAPIVLQHPNPISPAPVEPPADPFSEYFQPPTALYPTPLPRPPAPGYPINDVTVPGLSRPGTARPATSRVLELKQPEVEAQPKEPAAAEVDSIIAAEIPLVTAYDARHEHILQLVAQVPAGRFICAGCANEGFTTAYHCSEGCSTFDLHEGCLQESDVAGSSSVSVGAEDDAPDMRVYPGHKHPLTWLETVYAGDYSCKGCGGGGSGQVWHCMDCHYDLHPACMR